MNHYLHSLLLLLLLNTMACDPKVNLTPSEGTNILTTHGSLYLGRGQNRLALHKDFFAGHATRKFRLKLRISRRPGGAYWIPGITISLAQYKDDILPAGWPRYDVLHTFSSLPSGADSTGAFWTPYIPGNYVRLSVDSDNFVDVGFSGTHLLIQEVEFDWESKKALSIPSRNDVRKKNRLPALSLQEAREAHGFLPGMTLSAYFSFHPPAPGRFGLYISPLNTNVKHNVGLSVSISTSGFESPALTQTRLTPHRGDTGVYFEIDLNGSAYIGISTVATCYYSICMTPIIRRYSPVIEMADGLSQSQAPPLSPSAYSTAMFYHRPPHDNVVNSYLWPRPAPYLHRVRELMVLGSAALLAATEGYTRYGGAHIYQSEHYFLNSDIYLHKKYDRAYASWTKINLYQNHLDNPIQGGRTLRHEWGHYEFSLDDEYVDANPTMPSIDLDNNSMMGLGYTDEMCSGYNHVASAFHFGGGLYWYSQHGNENWPIFSSLYGIAQNIRYPSASGTYLDVLNQLESIMEFHYYN